MQSLQLTLTLADVNQILDALGTRPYAEVFGLIASIRQQAENQLDGAGASPVEEENGSAGQGSLQSGVAAINREDER